MPNDEKKDTFMGILAEGHVREAERLRKAWVDHVLISLEKLGKNIDGLSSDLHSAKDALYKEIVNVRETIRKEMKESRTGSDRELEKVEKRLGKILDDLTEKVNTISIHSLKEELSKEIIRVKDGLRTELTTLKEHKIAPLQTDLTKITTKISMIAFIVSIVGVAVVEGFIKWILPVITKVLAGSGPL